MTDTIPNVVGKRDRFLFYWSGHGDQRVRSDGGIAFGFLPLANSKVGAFSSMVSMDDLVRWNNYLDAKQALFVLDACLSGLAGLQRKSAPPNQTRLDQLAQPSRHLLTAGTSTEEVIAGSRWNGSLFTDAFISGAKGGAAPPGEVVSLHRLIEYIQTKVALEQAAAHWKRALTPQLRDLGVSNGAFFFISSNVIQPDIEVTSLGQDQSVRVRQELTQNEIKGLQNDDGKANEIESGLFTAPIPLVVPSIQRYQSPDKSQPLGAAGGRIWVDFNAGDDWFRLSGGDGFVLLNDDQIRTVADQLSEGPKYPMMVVVRSAPLFATADLKSSAKGSVGGRLYVDAYAGNNFYHLADGRGFVRLP
ncbi:hypothetical protein CO670_04480 [Rhizobium sp. J15]|uniref:caspase family protein n=1 Tax=Rhizobium sp. J15 TaxID=2035450 RepID=UPI000BE8F6D1|nr:caspase family protein [Rhizobium sp. J15]PDT18057.1 hypothetical protein CO670_04480 [Rhizobium sp. J15]